MTKQYESPIIEVTFFQKKNLVVTSLTDGVVDDGTGNNSGNFDEMFGD